MNLPLSKTVFAVLLVSSITSCFKDMDIHPKQNDIPPKKVSNEMRSYFQIRTGQVLVYQDSATGYFDSVKVDCFGIIPGVCIGPGPSGPPHTLNYYDCEYVSIQLTKLQNGSLWLSASSFDSPNILSGTFATLGWTGTIYCDGSISKLSSFRAGNKTYQDVIKYPSDSTKVESFYWAKEVGIIKFTIQKDQQRFTYTLTS